MTGNLLLCCGQVPEMVRGIWEPHEPTISCRWPTPPGMAVVFFDGCCLGNPGPYGGAAVVHAPGANRTEVVTTIGEGTNNEAEYWGLILGLKKAREMGFTRVRVHGDSELVIKQMKGEYAVRNERLALLHDMAKGACRGMSVEFAWIPREHNGEADKHSRSAATDYAAAIRLRTT